MAPARKKISVMPVSFPNDENSGVPQPSSKEPVKKVSNIHKLDIPLIKKILTAVKGFNKSCTAIICDFDKQHIIVKKDGVYRIYNFEGEEILAYTFTGTGKDMRIRR